MDPILELLLIFLLPLTYAVVALSYRDRLNKKLEREKPIDAFLLHSPGETLGRRLQSFSDDYALLYLGALITPVLVGGVGYYFLPSLFPSQPFTVFVTSLIAFGASALLSLRALKWYFDKRDHLKLRYLGERLVGEELARLQRRGYRVFHDVPLGDTADKAINHLAIGINGIFVIETVMHRRRSDHPEEVRTIEDRILFGSDELNQPNDRLARKIEDLAAILKEDCPDQAKPVGILVAPGWQVPSQQFCGPYALVSLNNLARYILDSESELMPDGSEESIARFIEARTKKKAL